METMDNRLDSAGISPAAMTPMPNRRAMSRWVYLGLLVLAILGHFVLPWVEQSDFEVRGTANAIGMLGHQHGGIRIEFQVTRDTPSPPATGLLRLTKYTGVASLIAVGLALGCALIPRKVPGLALLSILSVLVSLGMQAVLLMKVGKMNMFNGDPQDMMMVYGILPMKADAAWGLYVMVAVTAAAAIGGWWHWKGSKA